MSIDRGIGEGHSALEDRVSRLEKLYFKNFCLRCNKASIILNIADCKDQKCPYDRIPAYKQVYRLDDNGNKKPW